MKRVIILHGTGESPQSFWMPYIKRELEKKGYKITIPQLPHTNAPVLAEQLAEALKQEYTDDTVVMGHSSGCPLILSVLENIQGKIDKVIMVGGYSQPLTTLLDSTYNIKEKYDWEVIKKRCREFIFINGANDPWGADDMQGRMMFDKLGGMLIINNEGHMGSDTYNQPYKQFPLLLKLID